LVGTPVGLHDRVEHRRRIEGKHVD
jgi:hypothetical protein